MTNADAPFLTIKGISEDMRNPFTGNKLDGKYKESGVNVVYMMDPHIDHSDGFKYNSDDVPWYHVGTDIFNEENWQSIDPR